MTTKPLSKPGKSARRGSRPAKGGARPGRNASGRVHLYVGISLDGYLAASDGGVDWLAPYVDARAGYAPFIKTIGSTIMGRATYDFAAAHGYSDFGMPSYVVTHRPFVPPSPSVIPYSGDLPALVRQIRERHPKDIWLMGGGILTKAFEEADGAWRSSPRSSAQASPCSRPPRFRSAASGSCARTRIRAVSSSCVTSGPLRRATGASASPYPVILRSGSDEGSALEW